MVTVNITLQK